MMYRFIAFLAFALYSAFSIGIVGAQEMVANKQADIRITAGGKTIGAYILDHPTSRDFLARLPMTVTMTRSGEREYHGRPDVEISKDGPKQRRFENGDLGYWAPGGYLAIFMDKTVRPDIVDLIVMGRVTTSLSDIRSMSSSEEMTFEVVPAAAE